LRDGVVVGLANHTVLIGRDGTEHPIDDSAAPILDERGEIVGCVLVFRDVGERRLADHAVRRSERELSDFFDTAAIGLHLAGPDGVIIRVNQHELDLLGYSREEYVGHHVREFHADAGVIEDILRRLESGETVEDVPARLRCKDGSLKHVLINSSVLWQDGKFVHTRCFTRDVTDSAKTARSDAVLAAIVESSDDAIISKTLDGIVTSWNKGAEQLFGYTAEEMIGRPIAILAPPDRATEMPGILEKLRAGQRIEHFDTERLHKDGTRIPVSLSISPVRDASGRIIGASKIARDNRDRKRVEEEKEQLLSAERSARVEAERANRLKEEFLATISHELRTPLSAILGWARLLLTRDYSDAERRKGLEVIERNARLQTQIIEDLLDMSRIISGKVRLDVQRVGLIPVIEAALETVRPAALAKEIRLHSMLDPSAGQVLGDSNRLQQVVGNLLSNSVKFTPKGGRVQISLERVASHIQIVVSDSGQGIKPEFVPYVFDRFRQGDPSTTRVHGGLGIGLAIVKSLAELHGGTVSAESEGEGRGATFKVELPLAVVNLAGEDDRVHPRASPVTLGRQKDPSLDGLTILVVDDEPDARDLIRRLLEERGASVVTAESANNAMSLFEHSPPDVLVSDIGMPHQDGYELIDRVRRFEKRARIHKVPALALTAFARWEDRTRALLAGYEMHVAKPVEPSELVASIAALARRHG
jgi:PAS domain S-box-containing protein